MSEAPKKSKKKPQGPKHTEKNTALTPLEVVGTEMAGIPVQSLRTGEFAEISLQEIAWKPRAALFVAKHGIGVLEEIILSGEEMTKDRIKALELLMAYTYGKPAQRVEHTGKGGGPIQTVVTRLGGLSLDDIQKIIDYVPDDQGESGYNDPAAYDYIDIETLETIDEAGEYGEHGE